jgi:hypothetical protein
MAGAVVAISAAVRTEEKTEAVPMGIVLHMKQIHQPMAGWTIAFPVVFMNALTITTAGNLDGFEYVRAFQKLNDPYG